MTYLLDSNVLIALCSQDHVHHAIARAWVGSLSSFAFCPVTEGSLVRYIFRSYPEGASLAAKTLASLTALKGYQFWPDDISYASVGLKAIIRHRLVTDVYLSDLADFHGSKLATFDEALA